jgi:hypothetical protein
VVESLRNPPNPRLVSHPDSNTQTQTTQQKTKQKIKQQKIKHKTQNDFFYKSENNPALFFLFYKHLLNTYKNIKLFFSIYIKLSNLNLRISNSL